MERVTTPIDEVFRSESELQSACVSWFRQNYPQYERKMFAIPNGGQRHAAVGKKMKAEGALAGVADLFLSIARKGFHGLYLEAKFGKGQQQKTQMLFEQEVKSEGYQYLVFYKKAEFEKIVKDYLS